MFEGLLLGTRLGSVDGIDIGINEGTKLTLSDGRVLCTTLRALEGVEGGIYDGMVL